MTVSNEDRAKTPYEQRLEEERAFGFKMAMDMVAAEVSAVEADWGRDPRPAELRALKRVELQQRALYNTMVPQ